jgi:uroporphyrinogen III methyltransferase / synthase
MMPRILVTRPAEQSPELIELLSRRGLAATAVPTVAVDIDSCVAEVDAMLATLDGAAWLIVTSANGARSVATRLGATTTALPAQLRVAAVGPATAEALRQAGIEVDHVPDTFLTWAIADGLGHLGGRRVVLARADAATPELREDLHDRGALVEEVVAYRTLEAPALSRDALRAALHDDLSGIAFASASAVRGLMRLASPIDRPRARTTPAFCIGPVAARQARRSGFNVAAVAAKHTATGLADAIAGHFAREDR